MKMKQQVVGVVNGIGGVLLWFAPWAHLTFMGQPMYQTGQHVGGVAYVLLAAWVLYGVFSWVRQPVLALISAAVAGAIALMFFMQVMDSVGWGLVVMVGLAALSLFNSAMDIRSMKRPAENVTPTGTGPNKDDPTID